MSENHQNVRKVISSKYYNTAIHVAVWVFVLAIPEIVFRNMPIDTGLPTGYFEITNLYHIGLFYFNACFLYPRLLNKRTWWAYFPALAVLIIFSYYAKLGCLSLLDPAFYPTHFNRRIVFFPTLPFLLASIFYRMINDRINYGRREKELMSERLAAELKFLRSQISPHFLFNTLTNLVALARKKSDALEPALIKLSDLMRYMLYESDTERTELRKEIAYLTDYIELQRLRFADLVTIELDLPSEEEVPDYCIEPMLLIPFVENAFKHGIGKEKDPFISVALNATASGLWFRVINTRHAHDPFDDHSSGIGLENVRNRLRLLYPGKFSLDIQEKECIFEVTLKIDLV